MYIQTNIDDQLFQQATKLTGLADKQALLEESLRVLIQTKKKIGVSETVVEIHRQKALEYLAHVEVDWHGKPIADRNTLYDDARG
jgi:Arc/MetJ family transcription regulator